MLQSEEKVGSLFNRGFPKIEIGSEFYWFFLKKKVILHVDYMVKFIVKIKAEKRKH